MRDSWTIYLSSALKDPWPVLQRISKSKATVLACPAPMVDDVGSALIRKPVLDSLSCVVCMDLLVSLETPLVPETVFPRFAAEMDAEHLHHFDLGSIVHVDPDRTSGPTRPGV
jgi:hypothetical protein